MECYFVSDLHGDLRRYNQLFLRILDTPPSALFIGGDILPGGLGVVSQTFDGYDDFIAGFLLNKLKELRKKLSDRFPKVFIILGNDDPSCFEQELISGEKQGLWEYIHNRRTSLGRYPVYGYSFTPPSPFMLKDWERYDVSRYVDPGCLSPEEGRRSVAIDLDQEKYRTIKDDIQQLVAGGEVENSIFLFHAPPYNSKLDLADLDGKKVDHVPLDPHVGSIAIQRFITEEQPLLSLHGHIHESARLSGDWKDKTGRTYMLSAAHDGPELALLRFDPKNPKNAARELL